MTTNILIARETQILRDIYDDRGQEAFNKAAAEYLVKIAALIVYVDGPQRLHAFLDNLKAEYPP